ncbi:hypothetical protein [Bacillus sp. T33-2]|uniref:hypothetical protein n=1 Tax=Bacillus sp. T33-2 TaxID=2054168 RepID=UPI0015E0E9AA|nr:hypothetical protein [Bacillus sp. T33-2]
MDTTQIASFVVRFQLAEIEQDTRKKCWRVKVTHIQEDRETLFESCDEALAFIKSVVET